MRLQGQAEGEVESLIGYDLWVVYPHQPSPSKPGRKERRRGMESDLNYIKNLELERIKKTPEYLMGMKEFADWIEEQNETDKEKLPYLVLNRKVWEAFKKEQIDG